MPQRDSDSAHYFQTTHWSEVRRAGMADEAARMQALESLLPRYLPAIHKLLTKWLHGDEEAAKDMAQNFVHNQDCLGRLCVEANQEKGRFRNFLTKALRNFLTDEHRRNQAEKRGGRHFHAPLEEVDESELGRMAAPHESFDLSWIRVVLDEVLSRMQAGYRASGREDIWTVFAGRIVGPALKDAEPVPYPQLSEECGHSSEDQTREVLTTGKRTFSRCLEAVIGEYEKGNRAVQAELEALKLILDRTMTGGHPKSLRRKRRKNP